MIKTETMPKHLFVTKPAIKIIMKGQSLQDIFISIIKKQIQKKPLSGSKGHSIQATIIQAIIITTHIILAMLTKMERAAR